jgi:hypothetical protein
MWNGGVEGRRQQFSQFINININIYVREASTKLKMKNDKTCKKPHNKNREQKITRTHLRH